MKRKLLVTALFAVGLTTSFVSCSHHNEAEQIGIEWDGIGLDPRIVHLFTSVTPETRASSDLQSENLALGRNVGVTTSGGKTDNENEIWVTQSSSAGDMLQLKDESKKVYFKGTDVEVYAYCPYSATNYNSTDGKLSFSVQIDQSTDAGYIESDLLCAEGTASASKNPITLEFAHKLAKVSVTLKTSDEVKDVSNATIYICNTNIATKLDIKTKTTVTGTSTEKPGTLEAPDKEVVKEIKVGKTEYKSGSTTETVPLAAIVVPQKLTTGTEFIKISIETATGTNFYYYTPSADKILEEGYCYNYTLTVKDNYLRVVTTSVSNWIPESVPATGGEELTTSNYLVSGYSETDGVAIVADAGDLATVLGDSKDNIENLKVVGYLNAADITLLRGMAGYGTATTGILKELDLSEAYIVGGETFDATYTVVDNELPGDAFINTKLESIILPKSLTAIGRNAFCNCNSLTTVTIYKDVEFIGDCAFINCTKLSTIYCYATTPPKLEADKEFSGVNSTAVFWKVATDESVTDNKCTVYVPDATAKAAYEAETDWNSITNITIEVMP